MIRRLIGLSLIAGLLSVGGLSMGHPVAGRTGARASISNPLRFLQAQAASYVLVCDASFDILFEAGGADQLTRVTGLPDSPTIAETLPMSDVGVLGGVAISPDGDTALVLFWAVPDRFITGFAVIRGLSSGTMRREAVMTFDPTPEGEAALVANDVAFSADGQSAVILRRRVDFPFDVNDPGTHAKLNVITGLPDAPVIGPDVDIPAAFAESLALTRDGDRAVVTSLEPKGLTIVSGLAPGGPDPSATFISLEDELGAVDYPGGQAPVGGVALTLDEDGVIVPIQNGILAAPQGQALVFTGFQSGQLQLARSMGMTEGVGP